MEFPDADCRGAKQKALTECTFFGTPDHLLSEDGYVRPVAPYICIATRLGILLCSVPSHDHIFGTWCGVALQFLRKKQEKKKCAPMLFPNLRAKRHFYRTTPTPVLDSNHRKRARTLRYCKATRLTAQKSLKSFSYTVLCRNGLDRSWGLAEKCLADTPLCRSDGRRRFAGCDERENGDSERTFVFTALPSWRRA